jgi:hypothetical protein
VRCGGRSVSTGWRTRQRGAVNSKGVGASRPSAAPRKEKNRGGRTQTLNKVAGKTKGAVGVGVGSDQSGHLFAVTGSELTVRGIRDPRGRAVLALFFNGGARSSFPGADRLPARGPRWLFTCVCCCWGEVRWGDFHLQKCRGWWWWWGEGMWKGQPPCVPRAGVPSLSLPGCLRHGAVAVAAEGGWTGWCRQRHGQIVFSWPKCRSCLGYQAIARIFRVFVDTVGVTADFCTVYFFVCLWYPIIIMIYFLWSLILFISNIVIFRDILLSRYIHTRGQIIVIGGSMLL